MTGGRWPALSVYLDRKVLLILPLGFASGLPLLLTYSTLSVWLARDGVKIATIGYFALIGLPYTLKFLWSPLIDRLKPPLPLGKRRGWGVTIQLALIAAILALGSCDPQGNLMVMAMLALLVSFLSASQDIVIDAYRVEILDERQQGPGAGLVQAGYRIAMLVAGAGALVIAARFGWFAAYATMAALLGVGLLCFLFGPEPAGESDVGKGDTSIALWFKHSVIGPFADFMRRPYWIAILLVIAGYKLGEAMAGVMAAPLYIALGFSLDEIAAVSKIFGFLTTIAGLLAGGWVTARLGTMRALLFCGLLQSAGNLFYVLQAVSGHQIWALALCVAVENLTGGMAGAALVAYLSGLCNIEYTATQYALLSSITAIGRTLVASSGGALATWLGWPEFFLLTTVVTLPALALLWWIGRVSSPLPADKR